MIMTIDENMVHQLNDDIQKFSDLLAKRTSGLSALENIQLRGLKRTIPELLSELLNSIGVQEGNRFIKVSNIDVQVDSIAEILQKENIKYEVQGDKIVVKYAGGETAGMVVVFEMQVINNWISCKSYLWDKHVKEEKQSEAFKILNEYNASTRHSKACILEDKSIMLIRNDNEGIIWDKETLREVVLVDIIIMLDFYKSHIEKIRDILSD